MQDFPAVGLPPSHGRPWPSAGGTAAFRCAQSPAPDTDSPAGIVPSVPKSPGLFPPPWRRHWPLSILRVGNSRQASGPTPPQGLPGQASPVLPKSADPAEAGGTAPPRPAVGLLCSGYPPPCITAEAKSPPPPLRQRPNPFLRPRRRPPLCIRPGAAAPAIPPVGGHRR